MVEQTTYAVSALTRLPGRTEPNAFVPDRLFTHAYTMEGAAHKSIKHWTEWGYTVALGTVQVWEF